MIHGFFFCWELGARDWFWMYKVVETSDGQTSDIRLSHGRD